jgi:hypothetical protein
VLYSFIKLDKLLHESTCIIATLNVTRMTENNISINVNNSPKTSKKLERNKVKLGPGYSLMDWTRLCSSSTDLAGTRGQILRITMKELRYHNKENDAWTVIRGRVYNITPYMKFHPGGTLIQFRIQIYCDNIGIPELMKAAGRDGTRLFGKY